MPATVPDFRATLPQFAAVDDPTIQRYLDMAGRTVAGDAAVAGFDLDEADAQIFLAAHLMSLAGIGPGAQAGSLAGFTNIKAGSLSLTRSERAAAGEYASSQFGILFWRLLQRYGGTAGTGFGVTGTGALPYGYEPRFYAPPHGEG